jgi:integrase
MVQRIRSSQLETRTPRLRLKIRKKPYFVKLSRGVHLGYRRNQTAGTWLVRVTRNSDWTASLGNADDHEAANGSDILDYAQADKKARERARIGPATTGNTVNGALQRYEDDLKERGGDLDNVARVRRHMTADLAQKQVGTLIAQDLRDFRTVLTGKMSKAAVNRTCSGLKAALNAMADLSDGRITNRDAWKVGLKDFSGIETGARNVILEDAQVRAIVAASYKRDKDFGLFVELSAVTGARPSQLLRLQGEDVEMGRNPRLQMPSSRKGKKREIRRFPVPIPLRLAQRLAGKSGPILLLDGAPWTNATRCTYFQEAVKAAGYDENVITQYALRHTSIVRQLRENVPIRIVAAKHDTSVKQIEKTYSRHILDHTDDLNRKGMFEYGAEVVTLHNKEAAS